MFLLLIARLPVAEKGEPRARVCLHNSGKNRSGRDIYYTCWKFAGAANAWDGNSRNYFFLGKPMKIY
ncbi:unnamed protein product [Hermetia illucens]|uniref:Uncharacterized protein n=1 Tax=Hermetia illucens TaxID=343691 RepID=A0A7R8YQX0_HERIL|nr:unnamed protein product [Hermetia illucens]